MGARMHMLNEILLYKELISRTDEKSVYYSSYIIQIEKNFAPILEYIRRGFDRYPDHGLNHSIRIMEHISIILSDKFMKELSSLEIVILFFSAFFHDSGMCLFEELKDNPELIREKHHLASKKVIDMYFENGIGTIREKERIKRAVTFICEAHGFLLDELVNDKRFKIVDRIDTFTVRYGLLAFLLRVGDLLDIESDRVHNFRMMIYKAYIAKDPKSYEHNLRHQRIDHFNYGPDELSISVYADNECQSQIWSDWFGYLISDIEKFDALYAQTCFHLPIPETEIIKTWKD